MANCPFCNALLLEGEEFTYGAVTNCNGCQQPLLATVAGPAIHRNYQPAKEDGSAIRLGMRGMRAGKAFEIIGRVQYMFDTGLENMWFLYFDDGSDAWLSEHFFMYAISVEVSPLGIASMPKHLTDFTTFHGEKYRLGTMKEKLSARWEGFLPYDPAQEGGFTCYEMQSFDKRFWATATYYDNGKNLLYLAETTDLESLQLLTVNA
jgi:hypothetical protein